MDIVARVQAENRSFQESVSTTMRDFAVLAQSHHDEIKEFNKVIVGIQTEMNTLARSVAEVQKNNRTEEQVTASKWRWQDRSMAMTSLAATALLAFIQVVAGLIQNKILPWFW